MKKHIGIYLVLWIVLVAFLDFEDPFFLVNAAALLLVAFIAAIIHRALTQKNTSSGKSRGARSSGSKSKSDDYDDDDDDDDDKDSDSGDDGGGSDD